MKTTKPTETQNVEFKQSWHDEYLEWICGFSPRNLWNMKLFYERCANSEKKLLQAVAVLRWSHKRLEGENQSIGIILCAEKDHIDVELALQDVRKPIAVSDYELIVPKREL